MSSRMPQHHKATRRQAGPTPAEVNALTSLHQSRQWQRLEEEARKTVARYPAHPSGWAFLGLALQMLGKLPEAVAALTQAVRFAPQDAGAHGNLGAALKACERIAEAEASYRKALAIQPDHAGLHFNLGNLLRDADRLAEAEASYLRALDIRPGYVAAQANLGSVLQDLGRLAEAEAAFRSVLEIDPNSAMAHNNLGNALKELGRFSEADACYRRALALQPDSAEALGNLGSLFWERKRLAEAEACYRRALEIRPDSAEAHRGLGNVLLDRGRLAEAEACYRKALALRPDYAEAQGNLLFSLTYQARPPALYIKEARKYGRAVSAKVRERFSAWSCTELPERLRVGIVSGDLCRHPVGYFLESVLSSLNQTRVELYAYPTRPKDDDLSARLRQHFARWQPLTGLGDEAVARLIREDGIHVLLDLSGHTAHNRLPLFAWRPAPVQVSWLGYWGTTGVAEMDWFLADEVGMTEAHRAHFTERVWCLPETRLCFTPPDTEEPVAPLPALERGGVTFGSFQIIAKINDEVLRVWSRVLASCPGSRLRMQEKALSEPDVTQALRKRMAAQGIDSGRVELHGAMPRREYLAAHAGIDILLDTFPFTGGTTTCEALWMGVPTLTLAGETLIARQGASLLTAAGLPDWIAKDEDEYVAKVIAFASNLDTLARLREGLRERVLASPLFDAPRFARNLEDALWGMWEERRPEAGSRVRMA